MVKTGIKIGTIAGIEIYIDYSWLIIFSLVTWVLAGQYYPHLLPGKDLRVYILIELITSVIFFASALAHEIMHSVISKKNGIEIRRIVLFLFGGVAELFEEPKSYNTEFKIAIAGPATSLLLAVVFAIAASLSRGHDYLYLLFFTLFQLNLMLCIFNLLPGFPLDGGRILRSIIWATTKDYDRSTRIASISGKVLAGLLMALGVLEILSSGFLGGIWLFLIGLFLFQTAGQEYTELQIKKALERIPVEAIFSRNIVPISPLLSIEEAKNSYFQSNNNISYVVSDSNQVFGTVSLEDLGKVPEEMTNHIRVQDVMRPIPPNIKISSNTKVANALRMMIENEIGLIPVKDDGQLLGVLTIDNIATYLQTNKVI